MSRQDKSLSKHERLEKIVRLLSLGHRLTSQQLSDMFSVDIRTIQGYLKNDLKHLNLQRSGTAYYLSEDDRNMFLQSHELAIMSASLMSGMFAKAVPKLSKYSSELFKMSPKNSSIFLFDFAIEPIDDESKFAKIVDVINRKVDIEFDYTDIHGGYFHEISYPLNIANFYGNWYLIAFNFNDDKIKTYHMKAIDNIQAKDESYLPEYQRQPLVREALNITTPWISAEHKVVTLSVTNEAAVYIKRKTFPNITILEEKNDGLLLQMRYYHSIEVMRFVKTWLPYISINDNEELRNELTEILTKSLKHYIDKKS